MRALYVFMIFIVLLEGNGIAQQKPGGNAGANSSEGQRRTQSATSRTDDVQALREDLTRMKALVQQMQTNLAFVDTSQSPLKHQFQLEIEMWQTLIGDMERRLAEPPAK
jgi:hypothetical protein